MNVADSEVVAAILRTTDADYTDDINKADIILLNTCSIRDNAEQRVQHRLQELAGGKHGKRRMIGVIGCMAERMGEQLLRDFAAKCADLANLDKQPKLEGRNMSIFLSPKPQNKK